MHQYSVICSNPEYSCFELLYRHEKEYTKKEFRDICEEAFCFALEKIYELQGKAVIESCDKLVHEYLLTKGFLGDFDPVRTSFDIPQYAWMPNSIKSEKLKNLMALPEDTEKYEKYVDTEE